MANSVTAPQTSDLPTPHSDDLPAHGPVSGRLLALTVGSIGVVYGDIGTSPIYAFRVAVRTAVGEQGTPTPAIVYGILSLILWSLIIIVTLKYVVNPAARRQ